MKALIVSGGRIPSRELLDEVLAGGVDLIIGADAGAGVLFREGIAMNLALGDFDSIEPGLLEQIRSQTPVITYQVRKNFTDTEAALEEAIERGATDITLLGATGNRLDHFIGNLGLLQKARSLGAKLLIRDDNNRIFLADAPQSIDAVSGWYISFFPLGRPIPDFTVENVKYPLDRHTLDFATTLTVSNEFLEGPARIRFSRGQVLVCISRD